jgi:ESF2/ABP1 family protein
MATRKRNEWLDAGDSEDEEQGYDSEAAEESRRTLVTKAGRSNKRRKTSPTSDDESDAGSVQDENLSDGDEDDARGDGATAVQEDQEDPAEFEEDDQDGLSDGDVSKLQLPKLLSSKSVEKSQRAAKRSGVIYISRIPPFMKPQTVKQLLGRFGTIGRIFLTPESSERHSARVKLGGNKKKSYTDGWVEFQSKKDAKLCAETLNTQIIGGKKGGWYHDDVWNLKYLKGFKWHHLTEQIANENAERASRMRAEIAQTTRENKVFLANVEKAKMLENMKSKRRQKEDDEASGMSGRAVEAPDMGRHFKQTEVKKRSRKPADQAEQPAEVKRVLSKIF